MHRIEGELKKSGCLPSSFRHNPQYQFGLPQSGSPWLRGWRPDHLQLTSTITRPWTLQKSVLLPEAVHVVV